MAFTTESIQSAECHSATSIALNDARYYNKNKKEDNTKSNDPVKEHHHPGYSPLDICPDDEVLTSGARQWQSLSENME